MLNIVVPMAGAGSRFSMAGYSDPKPLIDIKGVPMIRLVIDNLTPKKEHKFIFICQESHVNDYGLREKLQEWAPGCEIIMIDGVTSGAACTVLKACEFIDNDDELMIANSDQYIDIEIDEYLLFSARRNIDGVIMTMRANDPKWSYVGFNDKGLVEKVVEKKVISEEATVGIYNFSKGKQFVQSAKAMIANEDMVNGEYYVAPVYNYLIEEGVVVECFNIGEEFDGMYGLGTPNDLEHFLQLKLSDLAIGRVKCR